MKCPNCKSENLYKMGKRKLINGIVQRFKCRDCGKYFLDKSDWFLSNRFCKTCGKYIEGKTSRAKYCIECGKERKKMAVRRYTRKRQRPKRVKTKIIVCMRCGNERLHHAKGLCHSCYITEFRKKNRIKVEPVIEKDIHFSVEELKRDLGFSKEK